MAYSFIFNYNSKKNEMVGVTKTGYLIYVITPAQELSVLIFATIFFSQNPKIENVLQSWQLHEKDLEKLVDTI